MVAILVIFSRYKLLICFAHQWTNQFLSQSDLMWPFQPIKKPLKWPYLKTSFFRSASHVWSNNLGYDSYFPRFFLEAYMKNRASFLYIDSKNPSHLVSSCKCCPNKKGQKDDVGNYRPISLTSLVTKSAYIILYI